MGGWALKNHHILLTSLLLVGMAISPIGGTGEEPSQLYEVIAGQNGLSWEITPLVGLDSPEELYAYQDYRSSNPLVQAKASILFFYRREGEESLHLVIIHGPSPRGEITSVLSFWGLPEASSISMKDDPDDAYWLDPPSGKFSWQWAPGLTDGAVISGLRGELNLTLRPQFGTGITRWILVTGDLTRPEYIELPSTTAPLMLQIRVPNPLAQFTYSPREPYAGERITFDAGASRSASTIVQYNWDFDDDGVFESSSASPIITHAFSAPGEKRVTLQIEDSLEKRASHTQVLVVRQGGLRVSRKIDTFLPDRQTLPGYSLLVELTIEAQRTVHGIGIEEEPPEGWEIQPFEDAGVQFNPESREWLIPETLAAGTKRVLKYRLEVPERTDPGRYRFSGWAIACCPEIRSTIQGDEELEVVSSLPVEVAVSRLNGRGEIDLTLSNFITFEQILQAVALWKDGRPVPGTDGKRIDLETMVRLVAYWLTDTPVNQPLTSESE
jgi:hypothetical protein